MEYFTATKWGAVNIERLSPEELKKTKPLDESEFEFCLVLGSFDFDSNGVCTCKVSASKLSRDIKRYINNIYS